MQDLKLHAKQADEYSARFAVPISRVQGISEEQMFKVVKTGMHHVAAQM